MEPLDAGVTDALARARDEGVSRVVVPAYDTASWTAVARLATEHEGVFPALGLHPWAAGEGLDRPRLREALAAARAVAVGEIGLDYKIEAPGKSRQREVLTRQLELALELDLPVILHCRGAFDDLLAIIGERSGLRGVFHAYSRGPELAARCVAAGLHLGFGGAVTRPRAKRPRRSAQVAPESSLLLETDAPSIGLEGVPPESAEPRHVRAVAAALAELRATTPDHIAEVTTANARRLFAI